MKGLLIGSLVLNVLLAICLYVQYKICFTSEQIPSLPIREVIKKVPTEKIVEKERVVYRWKTKYVVRTDGRYVDTVTGYLIYPTPTTPTQPQTEPQVYIPELEIACPKCPKRQTFALLRGALGVYYGLAPNQSLTGKLEWLPLSLKRLDIGGFGSLTTDDWKVGIFVKVNF